MLSDELNKPFYSGRNRRMGNPTRSARIKPTLIWRRPWSTEKDICSGMYL